MNIYKTKPSKRNKLFVSYLLHLLYSVFGKVAGCMLVDFIKFKSFECFFPEKLLYGITFSRKPISVKHLLLNVSKLWLLLSYSQRRMAQKRRFSVIQKDIYRGALEYFKQVILEIAFFFYFLLFSIFCVVC